MGGGVIRAMRRVAGRRVGVERAWRRKDRDLGGWIFERASHRRFGFRTTNVARRRGRAAGAVDGVETEMLV